MSRDTGREVRQERAVRRERIATAVLAGLHSNPATANERPHALAERAVEAADALLEHLTAAESRDFLRDHERQSVTEEGVVS